jgi:aromatic ring-opening dioxygenase LigB subunit
MAHAPIFVDGIGQAADLRTAAATRAAFAACAERIVAAEPEVIVIATPHGRVYADSMHVSSGAGAEADWLDFGRDPERYRVAFDEEFVAALAQAARAAHIACDVSPDARLDHGCMVPLHFVRRAGGNVGRGGAGASAGAGADECKIVRISISNLGDAAHYAMGRCVEQVAEQLGRRAVFIGSGDLSHKLKASGPYGYNPLGPVFDEQICQAFSAADFQAFFDFSPELRTESAECGLNSFIMLAGVMDGYEVAGHLYSHEGPWGVGYGVAGFERGAANPARHFA